MTHSDNRLNKRKQKVKSKQRIFFGVLLCVLLAGSSVLMLMQAFSQAEKGKQQKTVESVKTAPALADDLTADVEKASSDAEDVIKEAEDEIKEEPSDVTLLFAGDILLDPGYAIYCQMQNRGGDITAAFSSDCLELMRGADYFMVNNEFPYGKGGSPLEEKQFTFRANPESVHYLLDMGVDGVSLANNHAFDYGETALLETFETLENAGIAYAGAGKNLEEAASPIIIEQNGQKIGIIASTQIERLDPPDTRGATDTLPGVFRCWDPAKLLEVVSKTKEECDFVVVFVHWGTESDPNLDWAQKDQAIRIADAGADVIIGSHPHILQAVEYTGYNGDTPVVYSLGNFWFNSKALHTALASVTFSPNEKPQVTIIPAMQEDCSVKLAEGPLKTEILDEINGMSINARLDENGLMVKSGE